MLDSLKTISVSTSGMIVTWMEWLPVAVRVAVGIATFTYMVYKTKNEWLIYESRKTKKK
tara:strand:- start:23827 stop:24003 length:177 start_codon:yes stop_codon:yes gene_type:complete